MGATRIETPQLVVPAGTTQAAPASLLLYSGRAAIVRLVVRVPPGPSGLVGFRLDHSSAQITPATPGTWIVADSAEVPLELDEMRPWPDWHLRAYNSDVYPHTLYPIVWLDDRVPTPGTVLVLTTIE